MMNPTDAAYLAGLIDGEGCFCMWAVPNPTKLWYGCVLDITQHKNAREIRDWMLALGACMHEKADGVCHYRWQGKNMRPIIEVVYPYLRIKRKQARLALLYVDRMPGGGRGRMQPKAWMGRVRRLMKRLNAVDHTRYVAA